jgi:hypothetical protein
MIPGTQVFPVVAAICSQSWIGPNVAWSFVAMADPDLMEPMFTEIQMRRLPEADFEAGGRRYGVFGHDWRLAPARMRLKIESRTCTAHRSRSSGTEVRRGRRDLEPVSHPCNDVLHHNGH